MRLHRLLAANEGQLMGTVDAIPQVIAVDAMPHEPEFRRCKVDKNRVVLTRDFHFDSGRLGKRITVEAGTKIDGQTIPWFLRGLLLKWVRTLPMTAAHDDLIPTGALRGDLEADAVGRDILRHDGVAWIWRAIYHRGMNLGSIWRAWTHA